MKLYTRTPAGIGIGIGILLTGQVKEVDGKLRAVEISLPFGCDAIVGYTATPLPKTPGGRAILWVDPGDLCTDAGSPMNREALLDEIKGVNDRRVEEMRRGPLGENWP